MSDEYRIQMAEAIVRIEAERDAALGRELQSRNDLAKSLADHFRKNAEISALAQNLRFAEEGYISFAEECDKLQQRLTAADERSDMLEVAIRKIKARLDAYSEADMRMPESSVEVCQMIADAALKPAEGGGDEA